MSNIFKSYGHESNNKNDDASMQHIIHAPQITNLNQTHKIAL